jgi:hypothetical protein
MKTVNIYYPNLDYRVQNPTISMFGISRKEDLIHYTLVDSFQESTDTFDSEKKTLEFLENVFSRYNNPDTNPLSTPEKQEFLRNNRLFTSMSVGGVVWIGDDPKELDPRDMYSGLPDGSEHWAVKGIGFEQIN